MNNSFLLDCRVEMHFYANFRLEKKAFGRCIALRARGLNGQNNPNRDFAVERAT